MQFSEMKTRTQRFLSTEDTVQSATSDTDLGTAINEAGIEYLARYVKVTRFAAQRNAGNAANNLTVGVSGDGQWVECTLMVGNGPPLKRSRFDRVVDQEEDTGYNTATSLGLKPAEYALALVSRAIDGASLFKLVVAPRPASGVIGYTAQFRAYASELVNATDAFECDDNDADQICRVASLRMGLVLGYGRDWAQMVAAPLPDQIRREMAIDQMIREPRSGEDQSAPEEAA